MPRDKPDTSTSDAALQIADAALDLAAITGDADSRVVADSIETMLRQGKNLRQYQIDEVIQFIRRRLDVSSDGTDTEQGAGDAAAD